MEGMYSMGQIANHDRITMAAGQIQVMKLQEQRSYPCCGDYIAQHTMNEVTKQKMEMKLVSNDSFTPDLIDENQQVMRRDPSSIAIHTLDDTDSTRRSTQLSRPSASNAVDSECRSKMCEWFYQVIDYCALSRDTVQICMSYLDTFLAARPDPYLYDRERYQLAAITSLYISIKLHEPVELDVKLLAVLSRGIYSQPDIVAMERTILEALQWRMNPPIPNWFVSCYMECLDTGLICEQVSKDDFRAINVLATFQTELGTVDYSMKCSDERFSNNEIAVASFLNAVEAIQGHGGVQKTHAILHSCGLHQEHEQTTTRRFASLRNHLCRVFALSRQKSLREEGCEVLRELKGCSL